MLTGNNPGETPSLVIIIHSLMISLTTVLLQSHMHMPNNVSNQLSSLHGTPAISTIISQICILSHFKLVTIAVRPRALKIRLTKLSCKFEVEWERPPHGNFQHLKCYKLMTSEILTETGTELRKREIIEHN